MKHGVAAGNRAGERFIGFDADFAIAKCSGDLAKLFRWQCGLAFYLDLRFRTEGLDLELARTVEARQRGESVADPYAAPAAGSSSPGSPAAS